MRHGVGTWPAVAGTAAIALLAIPFAASTDAAGVSAKGPEVAALADIVPGQWQLREIDPAAALTSLCITDPAMLIQLKHAALRCPHFVIEDLPRSATVQYSCPGAGHGRTTIKLETRASFHLDTQGIAQGAPFDTSYAARRMGDCGAR